MSTSRGELRLVAYADGASRGNPGPAAFGAVLYDTSGAEVQAVQERIGRATNNVAEYRGAIAALEAALALGATGIDLRMDSELVVRQLLGQYRVRAPGLQPLFRRAEALLDRFARTSVTHVRREENRRADALANAALDGADAR